MKYFLHTGTIRIVAVILLGLAGVNGLLAQAGTGSLRGEVIDPSGSAIPDATVQVTTPAGQLLVRTTNQGGVFEVGDLAPGRYTVEVIALGFAPHAEELEISAGQARQLNVSLLIATQAQEVTVSEQAQTVDTSPSNNASSVVIAGDDLAALPDDPDALLADLQALAGPSAGPSGGQIYIDGFTGGQLPPKSSIREIRINQNPFSAEFDRVGFGRIQIFTRPGTDRFRGQISVRGNTSALNSKNPFVPVADQPAYHSTNFGGNLGGPLSSVASFFVNAERRDVDESSIINAIVLDPSFNPVPFRAAIGNRRVRTNIRPRLDYQLSTNNSLTVRYQYFRDTRTNEGLGQFSLPTQAYDVLRTEQTLQVSDTQILGDRAVNETRFQYRRGRRSQTAQNSEPTVRVLGAFTGGGSSRGNDVTRTNHYEFQNYTSIVSGNHVVKFGGRLRTVNEADDSTSDFNGTFTFPSIEAYQDTLQGLPGGGASQYLITAGLSKTSVTLVDTGLYVQDDWRLRPNFTLSYGLRFETQSRIPDHVDLAPRLGLAWAIGGGGTNSPATVLRAGFGMFYNRFSEGLVLQAERLDGVSQQQFIVDSPDFFLDDVPPVESLTDTELPTVYRIDPNLRSPYVLQTAVSLERQVSKDVTLSVNYVQSRGVHSLLTNNINAPLPGTITDENPTGTKPFGDVGNIYQYESGGIFKQNQLITTINIRTGPRLRIFGNYILNYARGNTAGGGGRGGFRGGGTAVGFPSNPYNLLEDYGRSSFDVRHRVHGGGTITLPYGIRLSPLLFLTSSSPFNITVGEDLNGDSIFNDRPGFATSQSIPENVVTTSFGTFDTVPVAGATIIPVNYGTGPSRISMNLRVSKTFGFGGSGERSGAGEALEQGGGRRGGPGMRGRGRPGFGRRGGGGNRGTTDQTYNLTLSVSGRNVFNNVNLGNPVGSLSSRLFGQSNSLAGGPYSSGGASRRIDLQLVFAF